MSRSRPGSGSPVLAPWLLMPALLLLLTLIAPRIGRAAPEPALPTNVLPISEIHEGMTGYGLTVFHGTQIDTFGVKVLGVQRNARVQGSVILVELSGHGLEESAIPEGMSGSPVFLNGRLAGAVAFSWEGALRPIGGLTPAEEVLALPTAATPGGEPTRADASAPTRDGSLAAWLDPDGRGAALAARVFGPGGDNNRGSNPAASRRAESGGSLRERWPDPATLARRLFAWTGAGGQETAGLTPLPAGLVCRAAGEAAGSATPAAPAATIGAKPASAPPLVPGSAFGIQLVRGDADMGALGTVTWVRGDDVWTLGHPLLQAGTLTVPMSGASIIGLFPSRQMSFKMGTFGATLGAVHHDLRAGLTGQLGPAPAMIPVAVTIERPRGKESFRFEIARDPRLTPSLVYWCLYNAMLTRGDDLTQQTIRWHVSTRWRGPFEMPPLLLDGVFAGPSSGNTLQTEWTAPLQILLDNRHEPLELTGVEAELRIEPGADEAAIAGMDSPATARAGRRIPVTLYLQPRRSEARTLKLELELPSRLAPGEYRLAAASARDIFALESERAAELFADRSLAATLEVLREPRSTGDLALVLYARPTGVVVNGREFPGLPASVAGELLRAGTGRTAQTRAGIAARRNIDAGQELTGAAVTPLIILPPAAPTPEEAPE